MAASEAVKKQERPPRLSKKCQFCERRFSKLEHVRRHQRLHTGERPFQCHYCARTYARSDVLARHIRYQHEFVVTDRPRSVSDGSESMTSSALREQTQTSQATPSRSSFGQLNGQHVPPLTREAHDQSTPPSDLKDGHPEFELSNGGFLQRDSSAGRRQSQHSFQNKDFALAATGENSKSASSNNLWIQNSTEDAMYPVMAESIAPGYQQPSPTRHTSHGTIPSHVNTIIEPLSQLSEHSLFPINNGVESAYQNPRIPTISGPGDAAHFDMVSAQMPESWVGTALSTLNSPPPPFDLWAPVDFNLIDLSNINFPSTSPFSDSGATSQGGNPTTTPETRLPDDKLAQVQHLWPSQADRRLRLMDTLWKDIQKWDIDNVFHDPDLESNRLSNSNLDNDSTDSLFAFTAATHARLLQYASSGEARDDGAQLARSARNGLSAGERLNDSTSAKMLPDNFPSLKTLDAGLVLYFRDFHILQPFIHRYSFRADCTPSCILFPMCLIGLAFLGGDGVKDFVKGQIQGLIQKCRSELTAGNMSRRPNVSLLTSLASAVLTLCVINMVPGYPREEQTQMLYIETLTIAQWHGLFTFDGTSHVYDESWYSGKVDKAWKAWARAESAKRLISCLIMVDAFYSQLFEISPVLRSESRRFMAPCCMELFDAPNATRWKHLQRTFAITAPVIAINDNERTSLPDINEHIGMFAILSTVWAEASRAHYRLRTAKATAGSLTAKHYDIPAELFAQDSHASNIAPLLVRIRNQYSKTFNRVNPNCEVTWNGICLMNLCADHRLFEDAAGRCGTEQARLALDSIAAWSQSAAARRACVHAAQIFLLMSRLRASDGIFYHSEPALFSAAMVLGLYTLVQPRRAENLADGPFETLANESIEDAEFELLSDVDWTDIGLAGLSEEVPNAPFAFHEVGPAIQPVSSPAGARKFILQGGNVTFAGVPTSGGFTSSRHIFLQYLGLLQVVGKWNANKYCHILCVMSDAMLEKSGT